MAKERWALVVGKETDFQSKQHEPCLSDNGSCTYYTMKMDANGFHKIEREDQNVLRRYIDEHHADYFIWQYGFSHAYIHPKHPVILREWDGLDPKIHKHSFMPRFVPMVLAALFCRWNNPAAIDALVVHTTPKIDRMQSYYKLIRTTSGFEKQPITASEYAKHINPTLWPERHPLDNPPRVEDGGHVVIKYGRRSFLCTRLEEFGVHYLVEGPNADEHTMPDFVHESQIKAICHMLDRVWKDQTKRYVLKYEPKFGFTKELCAQKGCNEPMKGAMYAEEKYGSSGQHRAPRNLFHAGNRCLLCLSMWRKDWTPPSSCMKREVMTPFQIRCLFNNQRQKNAPVPKSLSDSAFTFLEQLKAKQNKKRAREQDKAAPHKAMRL